MPTFQDVSKFKEHDLGWAISRPVFDLTGAAVAIEIECKGCHVAQRYSTTQPGILSRFDHRPECRVLLEIKTTSEPWLLGSPNKRQ